MQQIKLITDSAALFDQCFGTYIFCPYIPYGVHVLQITLQSLAPKAEEEKHLYGIFKAVMNILNLTLHYLVAMQTVFP